MTHKPFSDLTDAEKGALLNAEDVTVEIRPLPFDQLSRREQGALLLAHHEGKRIEVRRIDGEEWFYCREPVFHPSRVYRIASKLKTPDAVEWAHVSDDINAIARNSADVGIACGSPPKMTEHGWVGGNIVCYANVFASYRRGTCDWQDSLVIRPGYEGK